MSAPSPDRVWAFNEWMRRFIEAPSQFAREFETVKEFLTEQANGQEPSYGQVAETYMVQLMSERVAP